MPQEAMDRETPLHNTTSTDRYIGGKRLPPWEVSSIPQVPHMSNSAPPLSKTEMQALPSLWATQTVPPATRSPALDGPSMHHRFAEPHVPSRTNTAMSAERSTSFSEGARAISPPSSESQFKVPAYEQVHEPVPRTRSAPVVALPGTMSSRSTPGQSRAANSKPSSGKRQRKKGTAGPDDSPPLSHRFTTAVKELFRKEHVDDRQFERIGERHWSED